MKRSLREGLLAENCICKGPEVNMYYGENGGINKGQIMVLLSHIKDFNLSRVESCLKMLSRT